MVKMMVVVPVQTGGPKVGDGVCVADGISYK